MDDNLLDNYNRVNRIENKLDQVHEQLTEQTGLLGLIQKDLQYHILRTDMLQEEVKKQDGLLVEAMKPIEWARMTARIIAWTVPIIAAIIGAWYTYKGIK